MAKKMRIWEWLVLLALLVAFVVQAVLASAQKSASFDEQYHLTAGYSYLRTGDFRLATTHPPLAGMVAGMPLLARQDIVLPLDNPLWEQGSRYDFSDVFLWQANRDPQGILVQARWGITTLGVFLLLGLFFWSRRMLGIMAGWLVLVLAVFDPNLIANSRVVTTDVPLTTMFILGFWRLWCWLEARRWYDLALAGLLGGLAMAAKYNGLLFWPIALFVAVIYASRSALPRKNDSWQRRLAGVLVMGLIGVLVLWGVYRFDFGVPKTLPLSLPIPAPFFWDHLWGTFTGLLEENTVKPDFLLGQVSSGGWWYYFPVALAVKTPLPLLILFLAGLAALVRRHEWRRQASAWAPPLFFLLMGLTGMLTIGYRHMLPAIPFAMLVAGNAADWLQVGTRRWIPATVGGLLVAWLIAGTLLIFPSQEAYFNPLAGNWPNWSNILVDSNLDWGQDLPALRNVMEARGIDQVYLGYFGKGVPEVYGVKYEPLPGYLRFMEGREVNAYNPYTPEPGWYAISATSLRLGTLQPGTTDLYAAFRKRIPDDRAGYSIYLYKVDYPQDVVVERPVVVDEPIYRVKPETLGIKPGVRVQPKYLQSGETAIYPQGAGFVTPAGPTYHPIGADLGGVFTLLGYTQASEAASSDQPLELTLYWRVGEKRMPQPAPTHGAPVSAFVHMVDGDPSKIVAQADGWEAALHGLEPGDILVQRMTIGIDENVEKKQYNLLAGLYSPQDWARLPVQTPGGQQDHVNLGTVEVR